MPIIKRNWPSILAILFVIANLGMDFSMLNTIIPVIRLTFHASVIEMQWLLNSYGIFIASTLVIAGRLADRYGRKQIYYWAAFGLAIALFGLSLSPSIACMIVFQILFALATAAILPISQVLIIRSFPAGHHGEAMGVWSSTAGISLIAGPIIGSVVATTFGWRPMYILVAGLTILALLVLLKFTDEYLSTDEPPKLDLIGMGLLMLTIGSFVLAVVQMLSWRPSIIVSLLLLVSVSLVCLLKYEKTALDPIVNEGLLKNREFLLASLTNGILLFYLWAAFFLVPYYIQVARGDSVLVAGFLMLFITAPLAAISPISGKLYAKLGPKFLISSGLSLIAFNVLIEVSYTASTPLVWIAVANILFGVGLALAWGASAALASEAVDIKGIGVGIGTFTTMQEIGGCVGCCARTRAFYARI